MRHVCGDILDAAWGSAVCRTTVSCTWIYRDGVWFGFVTSAMLLAVVLSWVDRDLGSGVLLGIFCLLPVTRLLLCLHSYMLRKALLPPLWLVPPPHIPLQLFTFTFTVTVTFTVTFTCTPTASLGLIAHAKSLEE